MKTISLMVLMMVLQSSEVFRKWMVTKKNKWYSIRKLGRIEMKLNTNAQSTRRNFIKTTAVTTIGMPTIIQARALGKDGKVAPSDRIVLGGIGLGRRGQKFLKDSSSRRTVSSSRLLTRKKNDAKQSSKK